VPSTWEEYTAFSEVSRRVPSGSAVAKAGARKPLVVGLFAGIAPPATVLMQSVAIAEVERERRRRLAIILEK